MAAKFFKWLHVIASQRAKIYRSTAHYESRSRGCFIPAAVAGLPAVLPI